MAVKRAATLLAGPPIFLCMKERYAPTFGCKLTPDNPLAVSLRAGELPLVDYPLETPGRYSQELTHLFFAHQFHRAVLHDYGRDV